MGRSRVWPAAVVVVAVLTVVVWGAPAARGDFASEQAVECSESLVGLSTCLTYVDGSAKSPTPDCCAGLKQVIGKCPKCLCILIKDRDNPQLGFKIDATRGAMSLPGRLQRPRQHLPLPQRSSRTPRSSSSSAAHPTISKDAEDRGLQAVRQLIQVPTISSWATPPAAAATRAGFLAAAVVIIVIVPDRSPIVIAGRVVLGQSLTPTDDLPIVGDVRHRYNSHLQSSSLLQVRSLSHGYGWLP